jgi:putative ABC transport system permease protein
MIRFMAALLWRETRASWKRLALFVFCIAAGVGGLVAVKSFSANLQRTIQLEARTLMAADVVMQSNRPFDAAEEGALAHLQVRGVRIVRSYEFASMARDPANDRVLLASVRAVGPGYPFYGQVLTGSGQPLSALLTQDSVLVEKALLLQMALKVGDAVELGQRRYRIADVLIKEPDAPVQLFRPGPRVLMSDEGALATGLIGSLSLIRYSALMKLPQGEDPLAVAAALKRELPERFARITTFDQAQPQVSRFLGRLTNYLNLVGLVALLLGGIGVAGAIRVFLTQKMDTLAILKCLGATSRDLVATYLLQALLMGLLGSLIGLGLGFAAQAALPTLLGGLVPVTLELALPWQAVAEGLALGLITAFWFTLPPLLGLRKVPPARVFRRHVDPPESPAGRWRRVILTGAWALLLAAGLAVWQTGISRVSGVFLLGLAGTVVALYLGALGLLTVLRRVPKPPGFEWRQGLSSLYRPGNQSAAVVVSLGLGVLLLLSVFLIHNDLLEQLGPLSRGDTPNLFFIDIQPAQRQPFAEVVRAGGLEPPVLTPVVRGRIVALKGEPVRIDEEPDRHRQRHLRYEYTMTYRDRLEEGETVVAGRFAPRPDVPGAQVSVADWWAEDSGVAVGDTLTLDIQGVRIPATVTSIRKVDWANRRLNFTFVFLPGALEAAPTMYVTALRVDGEAQRAALQEAVVRRLPNVTVLDVEVVFQAIQQILGRIALVVQFMAAFCIAVGLVILLGAIATTRFQRIREAVLLKTLGATRGAVARILTVEYLLLGGLAGAVGAVAAGAFSWGLVTYVFEGHWRPALPPYVAAWGLTALLIAVAGLGSSVDVLMKKPLEVLREE